MTDPIGPTVDFLSTNVAGLTTATNLFEGRVRDVDGVPENATFVTCVDSPAPQRRMGQTLEFRQAILNIYVRNKNWKTGLDLAQGVIDAFNGNTAVPTGFLDAEPLNTTPKDNGVDSKGRYFFTVGLRVINEEDTS